MDLQPNGVDLEVGHSLVHQRGNVGPIALTFFFQETLVERHTGIALDANERAVGPLVDDNGLDYSAVAQNGVLQLFEGCAAVRFLVSCSSKGQKELFGVRIGTVRFQEFANARVVSVKLKLGNWNQLKDG